MNPDIKDILLKYWGYSAFRPLQEDIIRSVLSGYDTLALLPTGGGKSICFQVPALAMEGVCLVISPLIALMKDQVEQLRSRGVDAAAIYSGMSNSETELTLDNCQHGNTKLLYLSPERLLSETLRERLAHIKVSFIAVDEAHCISQWGYDFRPSYLRIAEIKSLYPNIVIAAFTATATPLTRDDIIKKLEFKQHNVFTGSFNRENLSYLVYHAYDKNSRLTEILKNSHGSAIVYAKSRKATADISGYLNKIGISADYYHAGVAMALRNKKQQDWIRNKIRVMVATNAFGMGIDKPDVRVVVHMDTPDSLEAYYQEAGRAGRDGGNSFAVLLYQNQDISELRKRPESSFPPVNEIRKLYTSVCNFLGIPIGAGNGISYDFELTRFLSKYELKPLPTLACLRVLEAEGLIELTDSVFIPSRIHFVGRQEDLYRFRVESPRFDPLIKVILRSTEGAFERFVNISEPDLARKTATRTEDIVKALVYLDNLGVISYAPRKDTPQITFLNERIPSEHIEFDFAFYHKRKQLYETRIEAVINYITRQHTCRNVMLLSYFGEEAEVRCGNCDYCRSRNKLDLNEMEFNKYIACIRKALSENPVPIEGLAQLVKLTEQEKLLDIARWMLDNRELTLTTDGKLKLTSIE
ncbi:MAG TPA: ATP-dependent DNA helicase RecQ [Bacteroidia bacterium]|nr:ATP-dependent DNA helicase RecQ [Bacteroidia bacterium]